MEKRLEEIENQAMRRYCEQRTKMKDWAVYLNENELNELSTLYNKNYPTNIAKELTTTIQRIRKEKQEKVKAI